MSDYLLGLTSGQMNPVDQSKLMSAIAQDSMRMAHDRVAWDAYNGVYPDTLTVANGEADPNVKLNLARIIVDRSVSFLFGNPVGFSIDPTRPTPDEAWLASAWRANRKPVLLQKLALNGAVTGHTFAKISPPNAIRFGHPFPRVTVLNPSTVSVIQDPRDFELVKEYWIAFDHVIETGRSEYVRQRIVKEEGAWVIIDERASSSMSTYEVKARTVWPYEWPPIIDCQNLPSPNFYYGRADLEEDVLHMIERVQFILSNWSKTLRIHAHPKLWGSGFTAREMDVAPDETIALPNKEARLGLIEMMGDMRSTDTLYGRVMEGLYALSRVPQIASGNLANIGALSGVALHILYQPLLELTGAKRDGYGPLAEEISRRMLVLGGRPDSEVSIQWPELVPADPLLERQALQLDKLMGLASNETLAGKVGYDWNVERERIASEQAEGGINVDGSGGNSNTRNGAGNAGSDGGSAPAGTVTGSGGTVTDQSASDRQPNHRNRPIQGGG